MIICAHPARAAGPALGAVWNSSASSSDSSQTNETTDKRIAAEGSLVVSDSSEAHINVEDISDEALAALTAFGEEILGFAKTAQVESYRVSEAALNRAFDSTPGAELDVMKTLIKWGTVAGGAAVAARYAPDLLKALR